MANKKKSNQGKLSPAQRKQVEELIKNRQSRVPESEPVTGWQRELVIKIDYWVYWLAKHWLAVFNVIAAIYVGLPILAPVLMNAGVTAPARVIYTVYSPMCHQMSYRSFFLFGEQYAYPRSIAPTNLTPIEAYAPHIAEYDGVSTDYDNWPMFNSVSRQFLGNEQVGYKTALCQRDIGIYLFVLLGGLLYGFLRTRINVKPIHFLVFIVVGMGPIGLDGFSQLFGYMGTPFEGGISDGIVGFFSSIFPLRESPPYLRTFTGALFGFMLVWLAYPRIDEGFKETEKELGAKLERIGVLKQAFKDVGK